VRNLRVTTGDGALASWINKDGERVILPLVRLGDDEWRDVGVYLKQGLSASDPLFATVFALPYGWKPTPRIKRAIERSVNGARK
jgi:hypothetical protein